MSRPSFIDELYCTLIGHHVDRAVTDRAVMVAIIAYWDAKKVMVSDPVRQSARIALCQMGVRHPMDRFPYSFEDITKKLAKISPEWKGEPITHQVMCQFLRQHHLSTNCH